MSSAIVPATGGHARRRAERDEGACHRGTGTSLHLDDPLWSNTAAGSAVPRHLDLVVAEIDHRTGGTRDRGPVSGHSEHRPRRHARRLLIGVPLGIVAGLRAGSIAEPRLARRASVRLAVPSFWLALELVAVLRSRAAGRRSRRPGGVVGPRRAAGGFALRCLVGRLDPRQLRSELMTWLDATYIRTAWAKGPCRGWSCEAALKNRGDPRRVHGARPPGPGSGSVQRHRRGDLRIPARRVLVRGVTTSDMPVIQGCVIVFVSGR